MSAEQYRIVVQGPDKQFAQRIAWFLYSMMKGSEHPNTRVPYEIEDQSVTSAPHEKAETISRMNETAFVFDAEKGEIDIKRTGVGDIGRNDFISSFRNENYAFDEGKVKSPESAIFVTEETTPGKEAGDVGLNDLQLAAKYRDGWLSEHPGYPRVDYAKAHYRHETSMAYWPWVVDMIAREKPIKVTRPPNPFGSQDG